MSVNDHQNITKKVIESGSKVDEFNSDDYIDIDDDLNEMDSIWEEVMYEENQKNKEKNDEITDK